MNEWMVVWFVACYTDQGTRTVWPLSGIGVHFVRTSRWRHKLANLNHIRCMQLVNPEHWSTLFVCCSRGMWLSSIDIERPLRAQQRVTCLQVNLDVPLPRWLRSCGPVHVDVRRRCSLEWTAASMWARPLSQSTTDRERICYAALEHYHGGIARRLHLRSRIRADWRAIADLQSSWLLGRTTGLLFG